MPKDRICIASLLGVCPCCPELFYVSALRHRYADRIVKQVEDTKAVQSKNKLGELRRQFTDEMTEDFDDHRGALDGDVGSTSSRHRSS